MPEMRFRVQWPDGAEDSCYSPSLVIKEFFTPGETYPMADFLTRSRQALTIASDRVQARYGMPCSLALGQLHRIEAASDKFSKISDAHVTVLSFHE
ncbi:MULTISPECIES: MSMEG_0570 family nitrogen starvation response protein [Lichenihabitans]|uniref:MSMEG_0570 family nitrogen starvation response protein n=1 Tax=Lichenihabitans TaxID=2723776 RepID=UPI001036E4C7|nr:MULTISPECIES: MSMEG_0570 family nitrogen starvation response protein [Lichenihabitans]UDL94402.1 MSMEG_0570 family nitrogen starvation response protein [Lichenihabitans sp. PAMC28606]